MRNLFLILISLVLFSCKKENLNQTLEEKRPLELVGNFIGYDLNDELISKIINISKVNDTIINIKYTTSNVNYIKRGDTLLNTNRNSSFYLIEDDKIYYYSEKRKKGYFKRQQ
jgi:hypothetical protein